MHFHPFQCKRFHGERAALCYAGKEITMLVITPKCPFFFSFYLKEMLKWLFFVFYCNHFDFIVLHKPSDTEGRTASVWRERIGQWASDSDLLILCNCMMALILRGHRARCGAANRCPSALCCAQLWVTVCHRIIVLNASGQAPAAITFAVLSQKQKIQYKDVWGFFKIEF